MFRGGDYAKGYALTKWLERQKRLNWFNLLVMIRTTRPEIAAEFDKLPYAKKICFTSFPSDLDSAFYLPIDVSNFKNTADLSRVTPLFYNIWDMLLYGKKTPLFKL